MKTFHFLSGLPRSGSTVLTAILNQHPEVYVTPTSPMLDILIENQNAWRNLPSFIANPNEKQLTNITRAMIHATWEHRPEQIIIDKNRGWGKNMPASTILFEKEIKMVATTRDLPSIMASWLTLLHNNPNSYMTQVLQKRHIRATDENMMLEMWNNMVKDCMESLVCAERDAGNRLLLIDYDQLIQNPEDQVQSIEKFLGLIPFKYDFTNIKSETNDDDLSAWGLQGMHTIRPQLKKIAKNPREVLGDKLFDKFVQLEMLYKGKDYK